MAGWRFDSEIDHNNRFTGKSSTRLDSNFFRQSPGHWPYTLRRCFKTKCAAQLRLESAAKSLINTVLVTPDQPFGSRTGDAALCRYRLVGRPSLSGHAQLARNRLVTSSRPINRTIGSTTLLEILV